MKDKYYLTADEIFEFENIQSDKRASETVFRCAMNFHQNTLSKILLDEQKFWQSMKDKMGMTEEDQLKYNDKSSLRLDTVNRSLCVVPNLPDVQKKTTTE